MLTHEIERYIPIQLAKPKKQKFIAGSVEHKKYILDRAVEAVYNTKAYDCGEEWVVRGKLGVIINICENIHEAEWEGMKAKFIEIYCYEDNSFELAHFSDLKKPKGN